MTSQTMRHDSHDIRFRKPFGAAAAGERVRLRLKIDRSLPVTSVQCVVWLDKAGREERHEMQWEGADECWNAYRVEITLPELPQLVWYHFQIGTPDRTLFYGRRDHGFGGEGQVRETPPPAWQITVYERGSTTPAWFRDRIMYQIFVDRFRNGHPDVRVTGLRPGSLIHAHWNDRPIYIKNEQGDVVRWDFFGGNLAGVRQKLGYLKSLGVGVIYLNPVFESPSNHKYDTADYHRIDPMFGDNEQFAELCREAERLGIRIILDGVFSHTGSDSLYFNRYGNYPTLGAWQSPDSPYYKWYKFEEYPSKYKCWWGIKVLPEVNELEPSYLDFVIRGENSVVKFWHEKGISGWRLDVADELPDEFLQLFRERLKDLNPEAVLIGEVWEDASNKISYGKRRDYLLGRELDSVMNYPFRSIAADFMLGRADAWRTHLALMTMAEHYPLHHFYSMMNLIGSHDVARILTVMGENLPVGLSGEEQDRLAVRRLKLLILWQMTFPGVPSIYYGDEAGVRGGTDPDNRSTYPWGNENRELLEWTREMAALRLAYDVFRTGSWTSLAFGESVYGYVREIRDGKDVFGRPRENNAALVVMNRSTDRPAHLSIPAAEWFADGAYDFLADEEVRLEDGRLDVTLGPLEGKIFLRSRWPVRERVDGDGAENMERAAGILLPVTALPSPHGIGDLGEAARRFVDFLAEAGQTYWQIPDIHPRGEGGSPRLPDSAFAGDPQLIDPSALVREGLLKEEELSGPPALEAGRTDIERIPAWKDGLLRRAFAQFRRGKKIPADWDTFVQEEKWWLEDWAQFAVLRRHHRGKPWREWPKTLARWKKQALDKHREQFGEEMEYQKFLQYLFFRQWRELRDYAAGKGIRLIVDVPLTAGSDSCDAWVHTGTHDPDGGAPLEWMKADGYGWWKKRLGHLLKLADLVRLVPVEQGVEPDDGFFAELGRTFGRLPVIAGDAGRISPEAEEWKWKYGIPGTKVMRAPASPGGTGGKARYPLREANHVHYVGSDGGGAAQGAFDAARPGSGGTETEAEVWKRIEAAYRSYAKIVIVPLRDCLRAGPEARTDAPGEAEDDREWRAPRDALSPERARRLAALAAECRRARRAGN